ncbi:MAG: Na+/H+ antiporter NhaA [Candidatus Nanopelagicales bacterium]
MEILGVVIFILISYVVWRLSNRPKKLGRRWLVEALNQETTGGALLLVAAIAAMIIANTGLSETYFTIRDTNVGFEALHLNLTIGKWAADGLLAIFFFVAGMELKHELTVGTLSNPRRAAVPIVAALGGMIVPATIFVSFNLGNDGAINGWAIPMATDIAFALAVLAVAGPKLPVAVRAFLLTLAVVDDLGAILVIAIFYTLSLNTLALLASIAAIATFGVLHYKGYARWWSALPLALIAWAMMHTSGVHATVAGLALGLLIPISKNEDKPSVYSERYEKTWHPISAGFAVPLFAFFAAGVNISEVSLDQIDVNLALGITLGLLLGKPLGIVGGAWITTKLSRAELNPQIKWRDVQAIGLLGGIGFTVSLLITELAYRNSLVLLSEGKLAVFTASVISALLASLLLISRGKSILND